jgi:hypothetical protein
MAAAVDAADGFKVSQDAFVYEEGNTFAAAEADYKVQWQDV